jgi:putative peptidoglycan lipid II flippase
MMMKKESILRSTLALIIITGLAKVLGYAEKVVLAYYYGTGIEVDVFVLIISIVLSVFVFFRELVEPGFLTMFLKIKQEDEKAAWNFFNWFLKILLIPVVLFFLIGALFPERIIEIFAPGFSPEKTDLAIRLIKLAWPAVIFLCVSNLTYITLNSQKKFILAGLSDIVFKGVIIAFLIILYPEFGIAGAALGILFASIFKLLTQLTGLRKNIQLRKTSYDRSHFKDLFRLTWPLLLGLVFSQANILIDNLFASYMKDGTIAALSYAKKVVEMPVVIFPYMLSIVIFPYFAELAIQKDILKLKQLFYNSMGWITFFFLPLSIFFFAFSNQIVSILLERGAFDAYSTALTAKPLAIYSIGMLTFAIETILVIVFFSISDTKTPILVGIVCVIINVIITLLLLPVMGYLAIAAASVISKTLKLIILFYFLNRKMAFEYGKILSFIWKIATSAMILIVYLLVCNYFNFAHSGILSGKKTYLVFCFFTGSLVYVLMCYMLKMKIFLKDSLTLK